MATCGHCEATDIGVGHVAFCRSPEMRAQRELTNQEHARDLSAMLTELHHPDLEPEYRVLRVEVASWEEDVLDMFLELEAAINLSRHTECLTIELFDPMEESND